MRPGAGDQAQRCGVIERREPRGGVLDELQQHASGPDEDHGPELLVPQAADEQLNASGDHRLHEHAGTRARRCRDAREVAPCGPHGRRGVKAGADATELGPVLDALAVDLQYDRIAELVCGTDRLGR